MPDILTDMSEAAMATAIESNLEACVRFWATQPLGDIHDHSGFITEKGDSSPN